MKYSHTTNNIDEVAYLTCVGFTPVQARRSRFTTHTGLTRPTAMFTMEGDTNPADALAWREERDDRSKVYAADMVQYRQDAKRVINRIIKGKESIINLREL